VTNSLDTAESQSVVKTGLTMTDSYQVTDMKRQHFNTGKSTY